MSLYTQQYCTFAAADDAAKEFSKTHAGCYYVNWIELDAWCISTLSENEDDPYWKNGEQFYPWDTV